MAHLQHVQGRVLSLILCVGEEVRFLDSKGGEVNERLQHTPKTPTTRVQYFFPGEKTSPGSCKPSSTARPLHIATTSLHIAPRAVKQPISRPVHHVVKLK